MRCKYCPDEVAGGAPWHDECREEWRSRCSAGKCPLCGEADAGDDYWCAGCSAMQDPQYRNYPGGA